MLLAAAIFLAACNDSTINNSSTSRLSALNVADSLELFYYLDPDGDSLRYTRYYTYLASTDTGLINGLNEAVAGSAQRRDSVNSCRSEGKIYMHAGEQPLRTLYFSTRCDSCCYLYYIKDAAFMYLPMTKGLASRLKELKTDSREPAAD